MKKISYIIGLTTILGAFGVSAQVAPPPSADPSRLQETFSGERNLPQSTTQPLIKEQKEVTAAPANADKVTFVLKSVQLQGNTIYSTNELSGIYNDKIGHRISLAELYQIRDAITKKYRENGYIISRAVIPAQEFDKNGANAKIKIIEGFINDVKVQGKTNANQRIINKYVEKIRQSGPLNSKNLEKYLLLMNDLAGTQATATLSPAANNTGGSDVLINLSHDYVDGLVSVDNAGSKYIGPVLVNGLVNLNSVFGQSEKITLRGITDPSFEDKDIKYYDLTYKQPIGYEGTYARFEAGQTKTHPGATLDPLDIKGDAKIYEAELVHPFVRSRKENISGRIALTHKDTQTDASTINIYDDKVTLLTLGGTFDYADRYSGINLLDLSATQGIDAMGSSNSAPSSRANADNVFTRYNFEASRNQKITNRVSLLVAAAGQYADEGLLASEEFGIGGRDFGRGYDFSEITGDSGIAGKIELQYGVDVSWKYLSNIQAYTFYDMGRIWQEEAAVSGEMSQDSLASAGVGLRFNITKSLTGYTELAKPLTKRITAEGDREVQFQFGVGYLF